MWKKCKLIILATKNKATIVVNPSTGKIQHNDIFHTAQYYIDAGFKVFDLYILSDDEIKAGDWIYSVRGFIGKFGEFENSYKNECKKIIATTDKSIVLNVHGTGSVVTPEFLPEPSQSFIDKYITEYNKGNVITGVLIEYETNLEWVYSHSGNRIQEESTPFLKVSKDNTITIKKVKDSWTKDEVIKYLKDICQDAISEPEIFITGICFDKDKFNKWIESNL